MESENVLINPQKILECLECDICSEIISACSVVECGHSFCENCITKWLNNNTTCPSCKHELKLGQRKNFLYEKIKEELLKEKLYQEQKNLKDKYLLFNKGVSYESTAFYEIFFKELTTVFNSYDQFFKEFNQEANGKIKDLLNSNQNFFPDLPDLKKKFSFDEVNKSKKRYI